MMLHTENGLTKYANLLKRKVKALWACNRRSFLAGLDITSFEIDRLE